MADKLTYAEEYVMTRLSTGSPPKQIAKERAVGVTAISKIAKHARQKLGARTNYEAVALFVLQRRWR